MTVSFITTDMKLEIKIKLHFSHCFDFAFFDVRMRCSQKPTKTASKGKNVSQTQKGQMILASECNVHCINGPGSKFVR